MSLIGSAPQSVMSLLTSEWQVFKSDIYIYFSELEATLEFILPKCIHGMEVTDQRVKYSAHSHTARQRPESTEKRPESALKTPVATEDPLLSTRIQSEAGD